MGVALELALWDRHGELVRNGTEALLPGKIVILFAVSVTKVKCILRSKVLLQHQVKYITGSEKMK